MSQTFDEIALAAMSLNPDERAALAERMWSSVTTDERASIENSWCEEVDRRISAADERGTAGIPAERVLSEIENDLLRRRA